MSKDQGRTASLKAYRKLADVGAGIDEALAMLRAVDLEQTVYATEIPEAIGYLEAVQDLMNRVVPRLADMAVSDDWRGHRP